MTTGETNYCFLSIIKSLNIHILPHVDLSSLSLGW